jgi:HEAT repeat protein
LQPYNYYDDLLKEVRKRDLSAREIASVVAELQEPKPDSNPVVLLSILCHSYTQAKQYTPLIERYLNGPDDYLASEALWVLCSCWDLSPNYINEMLAFMESAPQDEYEYRDRKRIAISCAQLHLERYSAPKLLRKIIEILEDGNEGESARATAYQALFVITVGDKWKYPMIPRNFDPNTDVDPDVMKLAKERLAREEEQEGQH